MTEAELLWYPHRSLRQVSRTLAPEEIETEEYIKNLSYMFRVMYYKGGVGLAAPQVGWNVKLFIANPFGRPNHNTHAKIFINPSITMLGGVVLDEEGCLSFPGIFASVERAEKVSITSCDHVMRPQQHEFDGFMARIIQHEFDHLEGILFIDRLDEKTKSGLEATIDSHKRTVKRIRKKRAKEEKEEEARKKKKAAKRKKNRKKKKEK